MTVIKTWCPCCGEVELFAPAIHLHTFSPMNSGRDFYEFTCPHCVLLVQRHADATVILALRTGHVPETKVRLPQEMLDDKRTWLTPLTKDDILDFVLHLQERDFLADFCI